MNLLRIIMVMLMKRINMFLFIIVLLLLIIPSFIYVSTEHNKAMWNVINKKVVESAILCKEKKECTTNNITLEELINKKYIDKIYNPVNKELINSSSYVDMNTLEFKVV